MILSKNHQTLIKENMTCYSHDTYFKFRILNYTTEDDFKINAS